MPRVLSVTTPSQISLSNPVDDVVEGLRRLGMKKMDAIQAVEYALDFGAYDEETLLRYSIMSMDNG